MVIWPSAKCHIRAHGLNSRGEGRTSGVYKRFLPMDGGGGGGGSNEPEKPRPEPPNHYCLKELRKDLVQST